MHVTLANRTMPNVTFDHVLRYGNMYERMAYGHSHVRCHQNRTNEILHAFWFEFFVFGVYRRNMILLIWLSRTRKRTWDAMTCVIQAQCLSLYGTIYVSMWWPHFISLLLLLIMVYDSKLFWSIHLITCDRCIITILAMQRWSFANWFLFAESSINCCRRPDDRCLMYHICIEYVYPIHYLYVFKIEIRSVMPRQIHR